MALTTRGYPYMVATDFLASVHTKIKDLADAIEAKVKLLNSGTNSIVIAVANTPVTKVINFPNPYPAGVTPDVVATYMGNTGTGTTRFVWVLSATNTSVTIVANPTVATTVNFNWFARG